jgi:hypothetical protein
MEHINIEQLAGVTGGTLKQQHRNPMGLPCIGCDFDLGQPPPLSPTVPKPPIILAKGSRSPV